MIRNILFLNEEQRRGYQLLLHISLAREMLAEIREATNKCGPIRTINSFLSGCHIIVIANAVKQPRSMLS